MNFILENRKFFFQNIAGLFYLFVNIFTAHFIILMIILYTHFAGLVTTLASGVTIIIFQQLNQQNALMESKNLNRLSSLMQRVMILRFLTHFHQTLKHLFQCNKVYGSALVAFLIVNCPINAYLSMSALTGKIPHIHLLLVGPFLLQQVICLFAFHFVVAFYSKRLHQPVKNVIHAYIHYLKQKKILLFRFRLAHYIEAFHNKNRYGMTYGNYGLVTFGGITKVCI